MSAFVIDTTAMHSVIRGVFGRSRCGQIVPQFDGAYTAAGDRRSVEPSDIGRKLFALNVEAVMQRYPDCRENPNDLPGPHDVHLLADSYQAPPNLARPMDRAGMVASYKAVRSLLYQCSEGDVPDRPLFSELQRAAGEIAGEIVRSLPDYDKAPW